MHLEVLVEDQSGKRALEVLIPVIIGEDHTFTVHSYKGIGKIPKGMRDEKDPSKRILLANLPKLLKGYGRTFAAYSPNYHSAVVLVCDLDARCKKLFRRELLRILTACNPRPEARFCIAIEEGEAWLLGDLNAVKSAYPDSSNAVLRAYSNDSICGTWETLADAVYPGGAAALSSKGRQAVGVEKARWADTIAPLMDITQNLSPSFHYFRKTLQELAQES